MSVTERDPTLITASAAPVGAPELLSPRTVPLGGPRAMTVYRTLPQRRRSLIGPWCFVDHYGPDDVSGEGTRRMAVPGHPHIGLQTVTWLFAGRVLHRDSTGVVQLIEPGQVNLMTAGDGVAHSEYATADSGPVHGAQLWIALPEATRHGGRRFEHFSPTLAAVSGAEVLVFLGRWLGEEATPAIDTDLFAAEVRIPAATEWSVPIDPGHEVGVLVDGGDVTVDGIAAAPRDLVALPAGRRSLDIAVSAGGAARVLVIGGAPLAEPIVMWWNFVARSHAEIEQARADWQRQVDAERATDGADGRFGTHPADWHDVLPAPELPTVRLRPREQPAAAR